MNQTSADIINAKASDILTNTGTVCGMVLAGIVAVVLILLSYRISRRIADGKIKRTIITVIYAGIAWMGCSTMYTFACMIVVDHGGNFFTGTMIVAVFMLSWGLYGTVIGLILLGTYQLARYRRKNLKNEQ